jgi:hypothetical protein
LLQTIPNHVKRVEMQKNEKNFLGGFAPTPMDFENFRNFSNFFFLLKMTPHTLKRVEMQKNEKKFWVR